MVFAGLCGATCTRDRLPGSDCDGCKRRRRVNIGCLVVSSGKAVTPYLVVVEIMVERMPGCCRLGKQQQQGKKACQGRSTHGQAITVVE